MGCSVTTIELCRPCTVETCRIYQFSEHSLNWCSCEPYETSPCWCCLSAGNNSHALCEAIQAKGCARRGKAHASTSLRPRWQAATCHACLRAGFSGVRVSPKPAKHHFKGSDGCHLSFSNACQTSKVTVSFPLFWIQIFLKMKHCRFIWASQTWQGLCGIYLIQIWGSKDKIRLLNLTSCEKV